MICKQLAKMYLNTFYIFDIIFTIKIYIIRFFPRLYPYGILTQFSLLYNPISRSFYLLLTYNYVIFLIISNVFKIILFMV